MSARRKIPYAGKPKAKRRAKWWDSADIPLTLQQAFQRDKTTDIAELVDEEGFWLSDEQRADPALLAVAEADRRGIDDPIFEFFRTVHSWSAWGREVVVDYFKRKKRKKTPIYDRTPADMLLIIANANANCLRIGGHSEEESIKFAAEEFDNPMLEIQLRKFRDGKHAALRRARKWRPVRIVRDKEAAEINRRIEAAAARNRPKTHNSRGG